MLYYDPHPAIIGGSLYRGRQIISLSQDVLCLLLRTCVFVFWSIGLVLIGLFLFWFSLELNRLPSHRNLRKSSALEASRAIAQANISFSLSFVLKFAVMISVNVIS